MRPVLLPISYLLVLSTNRFLSNRDKDQQREHGSKWDRKGNLEKFCIEGETWRTLNFCVLPHTVSKDHFCPNIQTKSQNELPQSEVKTDFTGLKTHLIVVKTDFIVVKTYFTEVKTLFHYIQIRFHRCKNTKLQIK